MNTGLHGAREHHWLRLRFTGVPDVSIIGARVEARDAGSSTLAGMRVIVADHGYKTGSPLEAHIGLGTRQRVDLRVILQSGATIDFLRVAAGDQFYELDLRNRTSRVVTIGRSGAPISR